MSTSSAPGASAERASVPQPGQLSPSLSPPDRELARWGGWAGLAGVVSLLGSVVVVVAGGLPDASDVETLTDFADIETGRIAEHFLYLGALIFFALHTAVLHRLLKAAHSVAAVFGAVMAQLGLGIMAASSMLHVSTSPLADSYTDSASPDEQLAIEHAWRGAQSIWDTMLATGLLLVPIGIALLGVAMRSSPLLGPRIAWFAIAVGALGAAGATVEIVDPELEFSAASVLAIVLFHLITGRRTLASGAADAGDAHGNTRSEHEATAPGG